MKIGVFDSGIGGKAVARVIARELPSLEIMVVNDRKNVPYGSKKPEEIVALTEAAIQPLIEEDCDAIVIACNTATALAIHYLRAKYPEVEFIGLEPMIKPASQITKSGTIGVCATPATLNSSHYAKLKSSFASKINVLEPDCSSWASMIENNKVNQHSIKEVVDGLCAQKADVIVLACTHYHWIKDLIQSLAGDDVSVIEPSHAVVKRVKNISALP